MEKLKAGSIRSDGFIVAYMKKDGTPYWESPEWRQKRKEAQKKYNKAIIYDPVKEKEKRIRTGRTTASSVRKSPFSPEERRLKHNKKIREKRKSDPLFNMKFVVRSRIGIMLKQIKTKKQAPTIDIIGCSWQKLKTHIESKFTEGMSWENHGLKGWHIDHIIPLSCATEIKGLTKLCHYTNLRPQWAKDNLKKKNNLELIP